LAKIGPTRAGKVRLKNKDDGGWFVADISTHQDPPVDFHDVPDAGQGHGDVPFLADDVNRPGDARLAPAPRPKM
jgi:hypothetical protein